jgi:addiction module RelE/StbE family toxin
MQVVISHQAKKQFSKIPSVNQPKVKNRLELLAQSPLVGKPLKGQLEGCYSLRCWPYRIIYQIDVKQHQIEVLAIIHRQGAYK